MDYYCGHPGKTNTIGQICDKCLGKQEFKEEMFSVPKDFKNIQEVSKYYLDTQILPSIPPTTLLKKYVEPEVYQNIYNKFNKQDYYDGKNWGSTEFQNMAFPIARKIYGNSIANELVSVQPMTLPSGLLFYLDSQYGTSTGNTKSEIKPTPYQFKDTYYYNLPKENITLKVNNKEINKIMVESINEKRNEKATYSFALFCQSFFKEKKEIIKTHKEMLLARCYDPCNRVII